MLGVAALLVADVGRGADGGADAGAVSTRASRADGWRGSTAPRDRRHAARWKPAVSGSYCVRTDRPPAVRCGRTGGAVPPRVESAGGAGLEIRSDASGRAGRNANAEDERLRGRSGRGDHDRSVSDRRPRAAVPQTRTRRGQRRSRAVDGARRRRHGIQSPGGAAGPDGAGVHAGAVPVHPRDMGRHTQRPVAETRVLVRTRSPQRHSAASAERASGVRPAPERAGPQPVSSASAGGAAANRGPRRRHGRHPRPARGGGLRSPVDRRPGGADVPSVRAR